MSGDQGPGPVRDLPAATHATPAVDDLGDRDDRDHEDEDGRADDDGADEDWDGRGDGTAGGARGFARHLLDHLETYPQQPPPDPRPPTDAGAAARWAWLQLAWRQSVHTLEVAGYFDHATGTQCQSLEGVPGVAGGGRDVDDHGARLRRLVGEATGIDLPWPPRHSAIAGQVLPEGRFFSLVEAVGQLAARPRMRWWHPARRHYHYGHFHRGAGQAVYRWATGPLLAAGAPGTRLTRTGQLITPPRTRRPSPEPLPHPSPSTNPPA